MTFFIRVLDVAVENKGTVLHQALQKLRKGESHSEVFERAPESFRDVPRSPFGYWVGDTIRSIFQKHPPFEHEGRTAASGGKTLDDFRWIRASWEVARHSRDWVGFAKGGAYSPFYSDVHLLLNWKDDAHALKEYLITYRSTRGWSPNWTAELHGSEHYLRPGLTWPRRTQGGLGLRVMPAGCVFADKGPAAFIKGNSPDRLFELLAIATSKIFRYFVSLQMAFGSYEVGVIQRTPVPTLPNNHQINLAHLARRAWSLKRLLDTTNETSHAFLLPQGLYENVLGRDRAEIQGEIESLQRQIDDAAFELYGIASEDRVEIETSFNRVASIEVPKTTGESDDEADEINHNEGPLGIEAVSSWLVGVAFGRFDPRLATRERALPLEPEPFDPLPSGSPGMYPDGEEPANRPDILVDDEGHSDDLVARILVIADQIHVKTHENLRRWITTEFFPLHIKMYSKSRRKAPIYWQLGTASANYSVWLYIHAFSKDTLFRVQNDYVAPKLAHEERRIESLTRELREGATAAQRKELAAREADVEELRAFLGEVKRVAPLWNPNLDDGVVINFAPLWRLVPQNKSWQKELKSTWDALCDGKYDWSHQAMHLWPERVVPKCAEDRSMAIAHGLEDLFWTEGTDGIWSARKTHTRSVTELVRERTSPAVKAALKSLLEAPIITQARTAGRGRKGASASANLRGTT